MSNKKDFDEKYEKRLSELQIELVQMQEWVIDSGKKIAIIFEGRDAAGKGGTIKRITEHLNPRYCKVVALAAPTEKEKFLGYATIKQVFKITKVGKIAGCFVTDGKAIRGHKFRVVRDEKVLSDNSLDSLKRFKDDVKEVASGFECGISVEDALDIKQGDILEIYTYDKIVQTM